MFAFFLVVVMPAGRSGLVYADRLDEVTREIEKAKADPLYDSQVILSLMIANPTEPVLLKAAEWPPGRTSSNEIFSFLKPQVARSPKLRYFFKKDLFGIDVQKRNVAVEMLAPILDQDQHSHEKVRQLAASGLDEAIHALGPHIDTNENSIARLKILAGFPPLSMQEEGYRSSRHCKMRLQPLAWPLKPKPIKKECAIYA